MTIRVLYSVQKILFFLFIWLLGILLWQPIGHAAEGQALPAPKRVALIIGNGQYESEKYFLPNAKNDATAIRDMLVRLGFDVMLQTDVRKTNMAKILIDFSKKVERAENAIFFYAGHAFEVNQVNYLVPIDARALAVKNEDELKLHLKSDFVDFNDILDILKKNQNVPKHVNLIFLDACRDNPWGEALKTKKRGLTLEAHGFAPIVAVPGNHIYYSTQSGTQAYDATIKTGDTAHSPYTKALLEYMEKYPYIDVQILQAYLKKHVKELTQGEEDGAQIPQYVSEQAHPPAGGIKKFLSLPVLGIFFVMVSGGGVWFYRHQQRSALIAQHGKTSVETLPKDQLVKDPQQVQEILKQAKIYYQQQRYTQALECYHAILAVHPKMVAARYGRARTYYRLKGYAEACADYNEAIQLNPQEAAFYYRRGLCQTQLNQHTSACADYERAIQLDAQFFAAHAALGMFYYEQHHYEKALEHYNWAIALNPRQQAYYQMRAQIKTKLGDHAGAEKDQRMTEKTT